jgi:hypothetical protein
MIYDVQTTLHKDWFRNSKVNRGGLTAWRSRKPTSVFQNEESMLKNRRKDIAHTYTIDLDYVTLETKATVPW